MTLAEKPLTERIESVDGLVALAAYERAGGYTAARRVVTSMTPVEVQDLVKEANLRGRGGAGFPTGVKWSFVPMGEAAGDGHKYLVCNADEMEPGTFKDRYLMEYDPHLLVEGMIIAAFAIQADRAYIFLRGEYHESFRQLTRAIGDANYDVDAAKKLADDLGVKLKFISFEWRNLIAGLVADKYDIAMSGITIRLERAKAVAFSEPYILIGSSPLVRKDQARRFRSWQDVDRPGVRVVVTLGTSNDQIVTKRFKRATIKRITAPASTVAELLANRADATITDNIAAVMQQLDHPNDLHAVNPRHPFEKDFFGYPVRQGDQTWLNFVNTWVKLNAQDGFFEELEQKWIAWE